MAMNKVQFQKGLSLPEFLFHYGTEAACSDAIAASRWPSGFICPCCAGHASFVFVRGTRRLYECLTCRRQTSLLVGTLLQSTRLPLTKWFLGIYLLTQSKTNLAALELMRHLGIAYNSAWRMKHKLMQLMAELEAPTKLSGFIQVDDAYLGGELNGGKPGRGSENKIPLVIAVSTSADGRPLKMVITALAGFTKKILAQWTQDHLEPACEVYSDGLGCFRAFEELGHAHSVIMGPKRRQACRVDGVSWVNTVLSNIKRAIDGCYHSFDFAKYVDRYFGEAAWRFNRRFNLDKIAIGLINSLTSSVPWPEYKLRHQLKCEMPSTESSN